MSNSFLVYKSKDNLSFAVESVRLNITAHASNSDIIAEAGFFLSVDEARTLRDELTKALKTWT